MIHKVQLQCALYYVLLLNRLFSYQSKVGLLPACNSEQIPFAYKMFTRTDEVGWKQSTAFKKAFSIDVDIEFVGVW